MSESINTYELSDGTLLKHFVRYPEGTIVVHYTAIKNGVESKKCSRCGNAINWLGK